MNFDVECLYLLPVLCQSTVLTTACFAGLACDD